MVNTFSTALDSYLSIIFSATSFSTPTLSTFFLETVKRLRLTIFVSLSDLPPAT